MTHNERWPLGSQRWWTLYSSPSAHLPPHFGSCQLLGHVDNDSVLNCNFKYESDGLSSFIHICPHTNNKNLRGCPGDIDIVDAVLKRDETSDDI